MVAGPSELPATLLKQSLGHELKLAMTFWQGGVTQLSAAGVRKKRRRACVLQVEALEARTLPSFLPATIPVNGSGAVVVVRTDLNGDGKADLVTANGFSNNISVLLGNGAGSFQPA